MDSSIKDPVIPRIMAIVKKAVDEWGLDYDGILPLFTADIEVALKKLFSEDLILITQDKFGNLEISCPTDVGVTIDDEAFETEGIPF